MLFFYAKFFISCWTSLSSDLFFKRFIPITIFKKYCLVVWFPEKVLKELSFALSFIMTRLICTRQPKPLIIGPFIQRERTSAIIFYLFILLLPHLENCAYFYIFNIILSATLLFRLFLYSTINRYESSTQFINLKLLVFYEWKIIWNSAVVW